MNVIFILYLASGFISTTIHPPDIRVFSFYGVNMDDCDCVFCEDGKASFVEAGTVSPQLSTAGGSKVEKPVNWFECKSCCQLFFKLI